MDKTTIFIDNETLTEEELMREIEEEKNVGKNQRV